MDDKGIRRAALTIATVNAFMTPFMGSAVNVALPSIGKEFGIDAVLLSWIPTSYILAAAASLVPFGRLADIYGRKKIYFRGTLIFSLFSLLCGVSPSVSFLLAFRVLQGIGSSMAFATGIAILTSVFPPGERGKVLGINVATVYIGLSVGPILGGLLTEHFTWRAVFLVIVPMGLTVLVLLAWRLKGEWAEAEGERFDWQGALIYSMAITGIMYGTTLLPALHGIGILLVGLLLLLGFVTWEMKVQYPLFQMNLFTMNRVFAFSSLAALINYSATFAVSFLLSLYLQHIRGFSPKEAGLVLIAAPVVMAVFSPFAGRLSDRVEPRIVASTGMAFTALGLLLLAFLKEVSGMGYIVSTLVLLGVGFALFSSPNTNAIMGSVEKRFYGIASGTAGTMRLLGMMVSMGIATVLFAVLMGRVRITPEHYPALMKSVNIAFVISSALSFAGIFASLVRGNLGAKKDRGTPVAGAPG